MEVSRSHLMTDLYLTNQYLSSLLAVTSWNLLSVSGQNLFGREIPSNFMFVSPSRYGASNPSAPSGKIIQKSSLPAKNEVRVAGAGGAQKPGFCPSVILMTSKKCPDLCGDDNDCIGMKKCCRNGCGKRCTEPTMRTAGHPQISKNKPELFPGVPASEFYGANHLPSTQSPSGAPVPQSTAAPPNGGMMNQQFGAPPYSNIQQGSNVGQYGASTNYTTGTNSIPSAHNGHIPGPYSQTIYQNNPPNQNHGYTPPNQNSAYNPSNQNSAYSPYNQNSANIPYNQNPAYDPSNQTQAYIPPNQISNMTSGGLGTEQQQPWGGQHPSNVYQPPNQPSGSNPFYPNQAFGSNPSYQNQVSGSNPSYPNQAIGSNPSYQNQASGSNPSFPNQEIGSNPSYQNQASGSNPSYPNLAGGSNSSYPNQATGSNSTYPNQAGGSNPSYQNPASGSNPTYPLQASGLNPSYPNQASGSNPSYPNQAGGSNPTYPNQAGGFNPSYPNNWSPSGHEQVPGATGQYNHVQPPQTQNSGVNSQTHGVPQTYSDPGHQYSNPASGPHGPQYQQANHQSNQPAVQQGPYPNDPANAQEMNNPNPHYPPYQQPGTNPTAQHPDPQGYNTGSAYNPQEYPQNNQGFGAQGSNGNNYDPQNSNSNSPPYYQQGSNPDSNSPPYYQQGSNPDPNSPPYYQQGSNPNPNGPAYNPQGSNPNPNGLDYNPRGSNPYPNGPPYNPQGSDPSPNGPANNQQGSYSNGQTYNSEGYNPNAPAYNPQESNPTNPAYNPPGSNVNGQLYNTHGYNSNSAANHQTGVNPNYSAQHPYPVYEEPTRRSGPAVNPNGPVQNPIAPSNGPSRPLVNGPYQNGPVPRQRDVMSSQQNGADNTGRYPPNVRSSYQTVAPPSLPQQHSNPPRSGPNSGVNGWDPQSNTPLGGTGAPDNAWQQNQYSGQYQSHQQNGAHPDPSPVNRDAGQQHIEPNYQGPEVNSNVEVEVLTNGKESAVKLKPSIYGSFKIIPYDMKKYGKSQSLTQKRKMPVHGPQPLIKPKPEVTRPEVRPRSTAIQPKKQGEVQPRQGGYDVNPVIQTSTNAQHPVVHTRRPEYFSNLPVERGMSVSHKTTAGLAPRRSYDNAVSRPGPQERPTHGPQYPAPIVGPSNPEVEAPTNWRQRLASKNNEVYPQQSIYPKEINNGVGPSQNGASWDRNTQEPQRTPMPQQGAGVSVPGITYEAQPKPRERTQTPTVTSSPTFANIAQTNVEQKGTNLPAEIQGQKVNTEQPVVGTALPVRDPGANQKGDIIHPGPSPSLKSSAVKSSMGSHSESSSVNSINYKDTKYGKNFYDPMSGSAVPHEMNHHQQFDTGMFRPMSRSKNTFSLMGGGEPNTPPQQHQYNAANLGIVDIGQPRASAFEAQPVRRERTRLRGPDSSHDSSLSIGRIYHDVGHSQNIMEPPNPFHFSSEFRDAPVKATYRPPIDSLGQVYIDIASFAGNPLKAPPNPLSLSSGFRGHIPDVLTTMPPAERSTPKETPISYIEKKTTDTVRSGSLLENPKTAKPEKPKNIIPAGMALTESDMKSDQFTSGSEAQAPVKASSAPRLGISSTLIGAPPTNVSPEKKVFNRAGFNLFTGYQPQYKVPVKEIRNPSARGTPIFSARAGKTIKTP